MAALKAKWAHSRGVRRPRGAAYKHRGAAGGFGILGMRKGQRPANWRETLMKE